MVPSRHILEIVGAVPPGQCTAQFVTALGVREVDLSDLWALSSRAAHAIKRTLPAGRVAGVLTPSVEMVACFVGCLRAGRDFVSLPLPARGQDVSRYMQQVERIAGLAEATSLLIEDAHAAAFQSLPRSSASPALAIAERLVESTTSALRTDDDPGALVQFSSGTTGAPKGVRLTGTSVAASVEAMAEALGIDGAPETLCAWVPLSHDMGLIGGLLGSWAGCTRTRPGYRYVCVSPELFLARPSLWMESCAANRATITCAPTFAYQIASRPLERSRTLDLSSLRAAVVGAEPIAADTLETFAAAGSRHGFREIALCPAYGLAEATLAVSLLPPEEPWTTRRVSVDGQTNSYVASGRILGCVRVSVQDVASGAGPVKIAGPAVCCGHIPPRDPPVDGWLDTGDLGAVADGELVVTGRSDDLLCVAGRHFFAWELERAASALPAVRTGNCAVVTDGRGRYVVLFESRDGGDAAGDALTEVRRIVSAVAGVGPSAVACVQRGTLPKTPSGKLRRNRIAADLTRWTEGCLAYREF